MLKDLGGAEGLMKLLNTSKDGGISSDSEATRRAVFGTNKPEIEYPPTFLEELWETFQDVVIIALCICAVISLGLGIYEASEEGGAPYIEGIAIIIQIVWASQRRGGETAETTKSPAVWRVFSEGSAAGARRRWRSTGTS